jgi:hypothetical protein
MTGRRFVGVKAQSGGCHEGYDIGVGNSRRAGGNERQRFGAKLSVVRVL